MADGDEVKYLIDDEYVAKLEPYRALCSRCNQWIQLSSNGGYSVHLWDRHRKCCLSEPMYVLPLFRTVS